MISFNFELVKYIGEIESTTGLNRFTLKDLSSNEVTYGGRIQGHSLFVQRLGSQSMTFRSNKINNSNRKFSNDCCLNITN